jgi:Domain of unknown function (DUF4267)
MSISRQDQWVRGLAIVVGAILALIGVRFLLDPGPAARFFGIGGAATYATAFHHVIALRDLWLGLLAIALGLFREWRALALWFALAVGVCFGDAVIAATSGARGLSIAFHCASGVFCAGVAITLWRLHRRASRV